MENTHKNFKFGIVLPWPGIKNAETEVISRVKIAARDQQMDCVAIDNFGHILNEEYEKTDDFITDADCIISLHFETPKVQDCFYYHALWNPPEYPLDRPEYESYIDNYIMNDDFLLYDHGSMSDHLKSMLIDSPRDLKNATSFMASFPASLIMKPNLEAPKLFYCGTNWDILVDRHGRNEGLMKLLDKSGAIKIFGPNASTNKAWGGVHPWGGYQCYQYPIPFDGVSLVKELNQCGICLVLSSDVHRRAGAVTNRAFEACAAGAVIISDNNPMMREMFGDTVFYVDYNKKNPHDTYERIMEIYQWIQENKGEARDMALRSQRLFLDRFTLDGYLQNLREHHAARQEAVAKALYAADETKKVMVIYICNTVDVDLAAKRLKKVEDNIKRQIYKNISLVCGVDVSISEKLNGQKEMDGFSGTVCSLPMFDEFGSRIMSDGQAFYALRDSEPHDYFMNTNADEVWFRDHVTTLIRTAESEKAAIAYSGQAIENKDGERHILYFENLTLNALFMFHGKKGKPAHMAFPYPGCFLISAECHKYMPSCLFSCLDGWESMAYVHRVYLCEKKKVAFSKRMTFVASDKFEDKRHSLIKEENEAKFIFGLSHYVRKDGMTGYLSKRNISNQISWLPLKSFIRMRLYRVILRPLNVNSWLSKYITKRYVKAIEDFERLQNL